MFFMLQEPVSTATQYSCRDYMYKGDRVVSLRWKHSKKRSKLKNNIPLVKKCFAISMNSKLVIIYKKRTYIVEQPFVVMCPCHAGKLCIL